MLEGWDEGDDVKNDPQISSMNSWVYGGAIY